MMLCKLFGHDAREGLWGDLRGNVNKGTRCKRCGGAKDDNGVWWTPSPPVKIHTLW
jgi:hypothetical protein